jgi:hypothetical protein
MGFHVGFLLLSVVDVLCVKKPLLLLVLGQRGGDLPGGLNPYLAIIPQKQADYWRGSVKGVLKLVPGQGLEAREQRTEVRNQRSAARMRGKEARDFTLKAIEDARCW